MADVTEGQEFEGISQEQVESEMPSLWGQLTPEDRLAAMNRINAMGEHGDKAMRVKIVNRMLSPEERQAAIASVQKKYSGMPDIMGQSPAIFEGNAELEQQKQQSEDVSPEDVGIPAEQEILEQQEPGTDQIAVDPNEQRKMAVEMLLRGGTDGPNMPSLTGPMKTLQGLAKEQASTAMQGAQAREVAAQKQMGMEEGKMAAIANMQEGIDAKRAEAESLLERGLVEEQYAFAPSGVGNVADWVAKQKATATNAMATPEARERAAQALDDAQDPGGQKAVLGEWWQVATAAIGAIAGGIRAGMGGPPETMTSFVMGLIDRKNQEGKDKAARMGKVRAAKERKAFRGIEYAKEDMQQEKLKRAHDITKVKLALEAQLAQFAGTQEELAIKQQIAALDLEAKKQMGDWAMRQYGIDANKDLARMKMAVSMAEERGPVGFAGLKYKPGAIELAATERKEVRDMTASHKKLHSRMSALLEAARNMSPDEYASWTEGAKQLVGKFGRAIDAIRSHEGWGARFEATEAEILIPAYLGKGEAPDFGFFVKTLEDSVKQFEGEYDSFIDAYDMERPGAKQQQPGAGYQKVAAGE